MPRILSLAAPANGSGKTALMATILGAFPGSFTALKFTTVYRDGEHCPKTQIACACRALHGRYTVITDPAILDQEGTDTGRMKRAGAARTLWGLSVPTAHADLWAHLTGDLISEDEALLTEGNRAVRVLRPRRLIMVASPDVPRSRWKSDTWLLLERADLVVVNVRGRAAGAAAEIRSPAVESLLREIRSRTGAPVIEQSVASPLASWQDGTLTRFAEDLLGGGRAAPPAAGISRGRVEP